MTDLCILVPHYGEDQQLKNFIIQATHIPHSFEIYVGINNPITEDLEAFLQAHQNIRYYYVQTPGSYNVRNYLIEKAKQKYKIFAFADSDCIITPDYLTALNNVKGNEAKIISGEIEVIRPNQTFSYFIFCYEKIFEFNQYRSFLHGKGVTANLVVNSAVFDSVGMFRGDLFSGGDNDFCQRCSDADIPMEFNPDLKIHHPSRKNFCEHFRKNARVFGGWYQRFGWHERAFPVRMLTLIYSFRPPMRQIRRAILSDESLSIKFIAIIMLIITRISRIFSHLFLIFGGKPSR
jgi:GT2 family glycosyltransferase